MIETSTETKKEFVPTDDMELIDDVFQDGKDFLFGMKKEDVVSMSRWHLKCLQDGTLEEYTRVVNDGKVGGKLQD